MTTHFQAGSFNIYHVKWYDIGWHIQSKERDVEIHKTRSISFWKNLVTLDNPNKYDMVVWILLRFQAERTHLYPQHPQPSKPHTTPKSLDIHMYVWTLWQQSFVVQQLLWSYWSLEPSLCHTRTNCCFWWWNWNARIWRATNQSSFSSRRWAASLCGLCPWHLDILQSGMTICQYIIIVYIYIYIYRWIKKNQYIYIYIIIL